MRLGFPIFYFHYFIFSAIAPIFNLNLNFQLQLAFRASTSASLNRATGLDLNLVTCMTK